ncbi:hypothetical protein OROMI_023728 [Orobanche minor]
MKTQIEEKFSDFYGKWMTKLEDLLQLLLRVSKEQSGKPADYEGMVNKLTAHHKEYYTFKWAAAHEDVVAFFTPVWLSPLENAHLWITGWKPSTAFRLIGPPDTAGPSGLTEDQVKKIAALRMKMKADEERVEREMERQHVAVADRRTVELARLERRAERSGSLEDAAMVSRFLEVTVQGVLAGLERVMKMADCVRLKTLKGVLDILSHVQGVEFLASVSMLQVQVRKLVS